MIEFDPDFDLEWEVGLDVEIIFEPESLPAELTRPTTEGEETTPEAA